MTALPFLRDHGKIKNGDSLLVIGAAGSVGSFDIIFDTVDKYSLKKTRHLLKPKAVYLTTVLSMNSLLDIIRTNQSLRKNILSFTGMQKAKDKISDLRLIAGLFEQHNLRAIIDRLYSLDEISDAFNYVSEGHKRGNVVITI